MTGKYNLSITRPTEAECNQTMQAVTELLTKLNTTDIVALANIVKTNPEIVATAKQFMGIK